MTRDIFKKYFYWGAFGTTNQSKSGPAYPEESLYIILSYNPLSLNKIKYRHILLNEFITRQLFLFNVKSWGIGFITFCYQWISQCCMSLTVV